MAVILLKVALKHQKIKSIINEIPPLSNELKQGSYNNVAENNLNLFQEKVNVKKPFSTKYVLQVVIECKLQVMCM